MCRRRAEEGVRRKLEAGLAIAEARIRTAHPVLSRSEAWRRERLAAAERRLRDGLRWAALEDAAAAMLALRLPQHRYLLLRDLAFRRDRGPLLGKELRAAKTPTREFTFTTRIWRAQNWEVVRHFRGRSERVPTVLSARATSIVTPRSDPAQPVFLVRRETARLASSRWPAWRLLTLALRSVCPLAVMPLRRETARLAMSWCWSWNLMYVLCVLVPWCSPLSLRALGAVRPFVPDWELSQVNGTLFPKRSSETQTMWSRLLRLWRHVSKERTRFETEPDTGLLGKGLSRAGNRVWNYVVVGGLGSLALLLVFPLVALAASAGAALAGALVPLWAPALALLHHALAALVLDLHLPPRAGQRATYRWFPMFEVLIWRIAILGVLQPIVALVVAFVLCPLCALVLLVACVSWWGLRGAWEAIAWRCVIARCGRVPAHDSAFCRRVRGPQRAHCLLTCGQAVAAAVAKAELDVLQAWAADLQLAIERPLRDYAHFVHACFGPFSVQIAKTGAYKQLEKECSELVASLREKVSSRRRDLTLGLSDAARARVRMTAQDLRRAVQACAAELPRVYGASASGDEWWAARGLEPADWHALAANTLVEVFDSDILVPLHEGEVCVPLESVGEAAALWAQRCGRARAARRAGRGGTTGGPPRTVRGGACAAATSWCRCTRARFACHWSPWARRPRRAARRAGRRGTTGGPPRTVRGGACAAATSWCRCTRARFACHWSPWARRPRRAARRAGREGRLAARRGRYVGALVQQRHPGAAARGRGLRATGVRGARRPRCGRSAAAAPSRPTCWPRGTTGGPPRTVRGGACAAATSWCRCTRARFACHWSPWARRARCGRSAAAAPSRPTCWPRGTTGGPPRTVRGGACAAATSWVPLHEGRGLRATGVRGRGGRAEPPDVLAERDDWRPAADGTWGALVQQRHPGAAARGRGLRATGVRGRGGRAVGAALRPRRAARRAGREGRLAARRGRYVGALVQQRHPGAAARGRGLRATGVRGRGGRAVGAALRPRRAARRAGREGRLAARRGRYVGALVQQRHPGAAARGRGLRGHWSPWARRARCGRSAAAAPSRPTCWPRGTTGGPAADGTWGRLVVGRVGGVRGAARAAARAGAGGVQPRARRCCRRCRRRPPWRWCCTTGAAHCHHFCFPPREQAQNQLIQVSLHRESDNPVPLDSELCAEILKTLEDAPDCDDKRECVERYRGGGSGSSESSGSSDCADLEPQVVCASPPAEPLCRVSGTGERALCRWTLTGRGVRLRADLASPEDVTLDAERLRGTEV
ncbi:hypothetical protein ACJJTC_003001 [Scirpophaga incertulas]